MRLRCFNVIFLGGGWLRSGSGSREKRAAPSGSGYYRQLTNYINYNSVLFTLIYLWLVKINWSTLTSQLSKPLIPHNPFKTYNGWGGGSVGVTMVLTPPTQCYLRGGWIKIMAHSQYNYIFKVWVRGGGGLIYVTL